jgi:hypothetical protein
VDGGVYIYMYEALYQFSFDEFVFLVFSEPVFALAVAIHGGAALITLEFAANITPLCAFRQLVVFLQHGDEARFDLTDQTINE